MKAVFQFLMKYKLYHLPFWLGYNLFWGFLFSDGNLGLISWLITLCYITIQPIGAYFNIYYLLPEFLQKGKYWLYSGLFLLDILLTSVMLSFAYYSVLPEAAAQEFLAEKYYIPSCFTSSFFTLVLVMMLKFFKDWLKSQKRNRELEKEKLETELQFLRSQLNPHFLFNTINSLFVLIRKDQEKATEVLARFSDMLRYQLYECNEPLIPLQNEIHFLEGYIELEELRKSGLKVSQHIQVSSDARLQIAPFILLNFFENAFKHIGTTPSGEKYIDVRIEVNEQKLHFELVNSADASRQNVTKKEGGIGLVNAKRRLDLLYPGRHELKMEHNESHYKVCLDLTLDRSAKKTQEPTTQLAYS